MSAARVVSIDVGGTFTDVLIVDRDGVVTTRKLPRFGDTEAADAALSFNCDELLYSTTVALNALLTGHLPPTGLIVTAGFREMLETARLPAAMDAISPAPPPPRLVPLEHVREVGARLAADGSEQRPVDPEEVAALAREFDGTGLEVVAVSLLHSYLNAGHEQAVKAIFDTAAPGVTVVLSSTVLPELREYERTLATVLNASLRPLLRDHLGRVDAGEGGKTRLMQAHGGLVGTATALGEPLGTALSGPAAAVIGARWMGTRSGYRDLVTFDVGGTSTDVALIRDGECALTTVGDVAGFEVRTSMLDVLSIGSGGGSIAHAAADKRWHVGPDSAGALPGPACYPGGGAAPTLTDAQLVLGRLPDALLGGEVPLDTTRAHAALARLGQSRDLDAAATARGILDIASHNMCGAIRRVCARRGTDPRDSVLFAMGGAGPLHAAEVAGLLGMSSVIVPAQPGLAAAWGVLVADIRREFVQPIGCLHEQLTDTALAAAIARLERLGNAWFEDEGIRPADRKIEFRFDARYAGMTHETTVACAGEATPGPMLADAVERFHTQFENLTGRSWRDHEAVEIVNVRLTGRASRQPPVLPHAIPSPVKSSAPGERAVVFLGIAEACITPVYPRADVADGTTISGPAIIEQYESTIVVPPDWEGQGDPCGNLIMTRQEPGSAPG